MADKDLNQEYIHETNDETPDNFTRFGDGHKLKIEEKYTDGEPPHEENTPAVEPENSEIPKKRYP